MFSPLWRCFVINLERSPHRLTAISEQLSALQIPFERFSAVDGSSIDPEAAPDFLPALYRKRHGKEPAGREIGCFLSHIGVIRAFLETEAERCLILEDDAVIDKSLPAALEGLQQADEDWDVALLYGNYNALPQPVRQLSHNHQLVGFLARQTGAVAYAINRKAARAYVENLLPMSLPIDVDFDRAWDLDIRFRGVLPFPVRTGQYPSDIGVVGQKFRWYRRLGTYARRGLNELHRYGHYGLRDPIWLRSLQYRLARQAQERELGESPAAVLRPRLVGVDTNMKVPPL